MSHRLVFVIILCVLIAVTGCGTPSPTLTPVPPSTTPAPPTVTPVPPTPTPQPTATPRPAVQALVPEMVLVEAGSFEMGTADGRDDEQPVHLVQLTRSFYVARYEVTFAEYDRFCADTVGVSKPSDDGQGRGNRPVTGVEWFDAVAYCNWLSEKEGLTPCYTGKGRLIQCDLSANGYRLPIEAEWEYAARGGHLSQGTTYAGGDDPDAVAWYGGNSGGVAHPVGQKQPNGLGLYDMSGNAWEWCWDLYGEKYYASSPAVDPTGPTTIPAEQGLGPERVRRGGNCLEDKNLLRVTSRSSGGATYAGNNGFRLVRTQVPEMVLVEPGSFQMGSAEGRPNEQPVHEVRITRLFYIAKYEVTFEEYDRFCEDTGTRKPQDSGWGRGQRPVLAVDWYDAVAYCNWLSEKEGLTPCYTGKGKVTQCDFSANGYRLPTEAEWEYAARGGHLSQGYRYAGGDDPDAVAWYDANSGGTTHPVGQKQPNELGLYDMSGNSYEWCWDWYGETYYASSPVDNPTGPPPETTLSPRGPNKVRRSCAWREAEEFLRVTFRSIDYAGYPGENGFRLARTKASP